MTREELAAQVLTASPRLARMIEAVMAAEAEVQAYAVGVVELHFAPGQVKSTLKISLRCYKLDKKVIIK